MTEETPKQKTIDIIKVAQLHSELHASAEYHYAKADQLWVMETIHGLLRKYLDVELCWTQCVWYAHTDSDMKIEDIGLCTNCGYCKPDNVTSSQLGFEVHE